MQKTAVSRKLKNLIIDALPDQGIVAGHEKLESPMTVITNPEIKAIPVMADENDEKDRLLSMFFMGFVIIAISLLSAT